MAGLASKTFEINPKKRGGPYDNAPHIDRCINCEKSKKIQIHDPMCYTRNSFSNIASRYVQGAQTRNSDLLGGFPNS